MAELKIPQKTLEDNFNLQDFKDDFNALNEEIAESKSELNNEITNNVNELNSKIDTNKSLTDSEIAKLKEIANTWETFKNTGGTINGTINVNDANLNGSLNFSGVLNNTDLKTENKKIFDIKRDTGDQIYFGNGSLKMVLDAKEFNAYGAFNCHSGINIPNNSISSIGYTKLPNGLIMQWGSFDMSIGQSSYVLQQVTLPLVYSNKIVSCFANAMWNNTDSGTGYIDNLITQCSTIAKSNITIGVRNFSGTSGIKNFKINWLTIGY